MTSYTEWGTPEIKAISEVIGLRCAGSGGEFIAPNEPGLDPINMEYLSSEGGILDQSMTVDLDETRTFDMRDLISPDIKIGPGGQVRARDVIPFVVLARHRGADPPPTISGSATPWTVPETKDFHSLISRIECYMINKGLQCVKAKKWANLWGKVGLIGLSPKNPEHITEFRTVVEGLATDKLAFTLFPKDAVENRGSISVLLRDTFKEYDPKCVPAALFLGNKGLRGSLRATHVKKYKPGDKTRNGVNKDGWRLLLLQGCPAFMRSLEQFSEDDRFSLGSGFVYIRGGTRKARTSSSSSTGQSGGGRPRSDGQRGQNNNSSRRDDQYPRLEQERRGNRRSRTDSGNGGGGNSSAGMSRPDGPTGARQQAWGRE